MNHYQVLNLNPEVYHDKIKRRYKELAKRFHPDKWSGDDSIFRRIKDSYEILSDVNKRKIYDQVYGFETIDVNNDGFTINIPLKPHEVLNKLPIQASYRRRNVCSCEGRDEECKYCLGNGIMSEDIDMIFRDTDVYYDGMEFTINAGGNINKYGEVKEIKGIIRYEYDPKLWQYQQTMDYIGCFIYSIDISDEDFQKNISNLGYIPVNIINYGEVQLPKSSFLDDNIISTSHPKLKVCLNVFVKDLSKLL